MARSTAFALAVCALLFSLICPAGAASPASASDIRSALEAYVRAYPHAAVIVGVVDGPTTAVYSANGEAAAPPNERSIFQIGSITKTFTATLLAQMVQDGEVALDDPITKYLPAGVTAPRYAGAAITLRSLAEQTSGLPRLPNNFAPGDIANPYAGYTVAMLYSGLSETRLTRAPGSKYEYSNFGVTLLGQILANAAHSTYGDLVRTRILVPLSMHDTTAAGSVESRARLVPGFTMDGQLQPPWDFGTLGAAGSIESDMKDMLTYLKANLAAPAGPLGAAMASAQSPRVPIGLNGVLRIGLIWMTNLRSGVTWHNGETGGYHAFIAFNRATNDGVVVLANIPDMDVDQLALHVLEPFVPAPKPAAASERDPSPYSGVYRYSSEAAKCTCKARVSPRCNYFKLHPTNFR